MPAAATAVLLSAVASRIVRFLPAHMESTGKKDYTQAIHRSYSRESPKGNTGALKHINLKMTLVTSTQKALVSTRHMALEGERCGSL